MLRMSSLQKRPRVDDNTERITTKVAKHKGDLSTHATLIFHYLAQNYDGEVDRQSAFNDEQFIFDQRMIAAKRGYLCQGWKKAGQCTIPVDIQVWQHTAFRLCAT